MYGQELSIIYIKFNLYYFVASKIQDEICVLQSAVSLIYQYFLFQISVSVLANAYSHSTHFHIMFHSPNYNYFYRYLMSYRNRLYENFCNQGDLFYAKVFRINSLIIMILIAVIFSSYKISACTADLIII